MSLRRILFWGYRPGQRPQQNVRNVPRERRDLAATVLRSGMRINQQKGMATCRCCGLMLGSAERSAFGFLWPEKAEHYVLEHDVWTDDIDALLVAAGLSGAVSPPDPAIAVPPGPLYQDPPSEPGNGGEQLTFSDIRYFKPLNHHEINHLVDSTLAKPCPTCGGRVIKERRPGVGLDLVCSAEACSWRFPVDEGPFSTGRRVD